MNELGTKNWYLKKGESTTILGNKNIKLVYKELAVHYNKSGNDLKKFIGFQYDLEKLVEHHKSLVKDNKSKGIYLDKMV